MYVARNVGVWKEKSNTLSVFDITILTPVFGERQREALLNAFKAHQWNGLWTRGRIVVFLLLWFWMCCTLKQNFSGCRFFYCLQFQWGFSFQTMCTLQRFKDKSGFWRRLLLVLWKIGWYSFGSKCGGYYHPRARLATTVRLAPSVVDRVLQLEDSFINLYHRNPILLRVSLSEVEAFGKFFVDNKVQVVSFSSA